MKKLSYRRVAKEGRIAFLPVATLLCLSFSVVLAGCGGGGGSNGVASNTNAGSGNTVENTYGSLITRAVGTAQAPVVAFATNATVTGIAGASFTSIIQNRSTDSLTLGNTRFAYNAPDANGYYQIYTMPFGGGTPTRITSGNSHKNSPLWSPNGSRFAYYAVDANGYYQIFTIPAAGGTPAQITSGTTNKSFPSWSPDGNKIAYNGKDVNGYSQIYTMPSNGGTFAQITSGNNSNRNPAWSPDGTKIAYSSDVSGYGQIYTIPFGGGTPTQITSGNSYKYNPTWSLDGTKIAWQGYDSGNYTQLYTIFLGSGQVTQITAGTSIKYLPVWSPDGTRIVYQGLDPLNNYQIYTIPSDAGTPTQITSGIPGKYSPSWSPFLNAPVTLIGAGGALGIGAAGFLFGQSGDAIRSILAFDTTTGTVASRAAARIANLNPTNTVSSNMVLSITANDALTKLNYSNYDAVGQPKTPVNVSLATGTTGAIVSYNASTGMVSTVLPYTATKSVGSGTAQVRKEGNALVVTGTFSGAYDETGINHSPQGAHTVRLDATTGNLISTQ